MDKIIEPINEDYNEYFKSNPKELVALEAIVFKRLYLEEKDKNSKFKKDLEGGKDAK